MHNTDFLLNEEAVVGAKTGEVVDVETLTKMMEKKYFKEKEKRRDRQLQGFKRKKESRQTQEQIKYMLGGEFIQQQYINMIEVCLNDEGVYDSALAFRLTYLCSYMDYDNILVFDGSSKRVTRFINEKDLLEVMKLNRKQLEVFKKICFDTGILEKVIVEGVEALKINKSVACKGKAPVCYRRYSIRVSVPHIQYMYRRATVREHKKLGYLTALLPFVNLEYCILCHNPTTEYKTYIQPLSIQDICKLINYDITKASRLFRELRNVTLNGEYVFMCATIENYEMFFLNPRLYYKGSTNSGLEWLEELFIIEKEYNHNVRPIRKSKQHIKSLKNIVEESKNVKVTN